MGKFSFNPLTGNLDLVGSGSAFVTSIADTNSIDLSENLGELSAELKISATGPDANNVSVEIIAETDGIRAQVDEQDIFDSLPIADTDTTGLLSDTDWDIFNNKIDQSEKGANNGVATLDAGGKVPLTQLPNSVMTYEGVWNATTNTPTLIDGTGSPGMVYRVSVAGTQDLGSGPIDFEVGDYAIYNAAGVWEKSDTTDAVASVNGQTGIVSLDSDDIPEAVTNLYYTDERAQDAVGTILDNTSSIEFDYDDAGNAITADVLPAGVDHDQLLNFVSNEHIDHSAVSIATAVNTSGLTGGGNITTTRNLAVDINGTTAETVADNADKILIYDNSATATKSMTRANFLSGIPLASTGDLNEGSFSFADGQAIPANITGFAFANANVRAFNANVSVLVDATSDLFEVFEIQGIQKSSSWTISVTSNGDDTNIGFDIDNSGQITYTSEAYAGFTAGTMKYRAITLSV